MQSERKGSPEGTKLERSTTISYDNKLDVLREEQRQGRCIKIVKELYATVYKKIKKQHFDFPQLWRFHKRYCDSLNKLAFYLSISEVEKTSAHKRLLDALDYALFLWTEDISLNGKDVTKHHLELYFQQLVLSIINKAWYYKRLDTVAMGLEALETIYPLITELKTSIDPDTLHLCARFFLCQGVLYMERANIASGVGKIESFLEALTLLHKEQKIRLLGIHYLVHEKLQPKEEYKIFRNVSMVTVALYNISLSYHTLGLYREALDGYRTCKFYHKLEREMFSFLPPSPLDNLVEGTVSGEIEKLELAIKMDATSTKVEGKQKKTALNPNEILSHIDTLWGKAATSSNNYENHDKGVHEKTEDNFKAILNTVKAVSPKKNRAATYNKGKTAFSDDSKQVRTKALRPKRRSLIVSGEDTKVTMSTAWSSRLENFEDETKKLNPDEYFKKRICDELAIKASWLEETNPKVRFGQHLIKGIVSTEKRSHKAVRILHGYLVNKRRDRIVREQIEVNPKVIEKQAFNEVGAHLFPLRFELSPKTETQNRQISKKGRKSAGFISPPARISGITPYAQKDKFKTPEGLKKMLSSAAEDLQRDILELERTMASRSIKSTSKDFSNVGDRSEGLTGIESHQNLANSIVNRANRETILKAKAKVQRRQNVRRGGNLLLRPMANK